MALPTSYLTSAKNLEAILNAIQGAKAPIKFTQSFLEGLGFKAKSDRLIIGVLKSLGFLGDAGEPTQRYYEFLDQTQGGRGLAEATEEAYSDLFQVNKEAYKLSVADVKNKLKTLTQGQYSDAVLSKMASTFVALASLGDFTTLPKPKNERESILLDVPQEEKPRAPADGQRKRVTIQGLQYVINIQLPESRDPAVYDALFKSMRDHLVGE